MPEGTDPVAGWSTSRRPTAPWPASTRVTGKVRTSVPGSAASGSAAMYVVRDGVALGLDGGANGQAWGYGVAAGRVTWTSAALPWPHFFSDLSGLGGSAAVSGGTVVITACPHLAAPRGCAPTRNSWRSACERHRTAAASGADERTATG